MQDGMARLEGREVEVHHQGASGEEQVTKGKLESGDENGYVVIGNKGKRKMIPKDKVYEITEDGFENSKRTDNRIP